MIRHQSALRCELESLPKESDSQGEDWLKGPFQYLLSIEPKQRVQIQEVLAMMQFADMKLNQRCTALIHFWRTLEEYGDLQENEWSSLMEIFNQRLAIISIMQDGCVHRDYLVSIEILQIALALNQMKFQDVEKRATTAQKMQSKDSKIHSRIVLIHSLQCLACYYQYRLMEAESFARQAISIFEALREPQTSMMHLYSLLALSKLAMHEIDTAADLAQFSLKQELNSLPSRNHCSSLCILGRILRSQGQLQDAEAHFIKALKLSRMDTARARRFTMQIYCELALVYSEQNKQLEMLYCVRKVKKYMHRKDCHIETCQSLDAISLIFERRGKYAKALEFSRISLERKQEIEGVRRIALACNYRAMIRLYLKMNRIAEASESASSLMHLSTMSELSRGENIENYHCLAHYELSIRELKGEEQEAYSLLRLNWADESTLHLLALSETFSEMGDFHRSYTLTRQFVGKMKRWENSALTVIAYQMMLRLSLVLGLREEAIQYAEILEQNKESLAGSQELHVDLCIAVSTYFVAVNDLPKAEESASHALSLARQIRPLVEAHAHCNYALIAQRSGKLALAEQHAQKCVEIAKRYKVICQDLISAYYCLALVMRESCNWQETIRYAEIYFELARSYGNGIHLDVTFYMPFLPCIPLHVEEIPENMEYMSALCRICKGVSPNGGVWALLNCYRSAVLCLHLGCNAQAKSFYCSVRRQWNKDLATARSYVRKSRVHWPGLTPH